MKKCTIKFGSEECYNTEDCELCDEFRKEEKEMKKHEPLLKALWNLCSPFIPKARK